MRITGTQKLGVDIMGNSLNEELVEHVSDSAKIKVKQ